MAENTIVSLFGRDGESAPHTRRIDLAHEPDVSLASITVLPSRRLLRGPGGEETLEPKVMQVLVALARAPGTILSRDDLIERCWEGRIVGDASINRVLSILRSSLRSVAGDAVTIETVPRVGYRLLASKSDPDETLPAPEASEAEAPTSRIAIPRFAILAGLVLLAAVAAAVWWTRQPAPTQPLTLAMLPLEGSSADDPFFATGLEAALRAELAKGTGMVVVSGETGEQMASLDLEPAEIAARMSSEYVLLGSIERGTGNIVLTTRLISSETGKLVFSEKFSSGTGQAEAIPARAARAILTQLGRPPKTASAAAQMDADDYGLYATALGLIRGRSPEQMNAAAKILERLTKEYPRSAMAWSARAKAEFLKAAAAGGDAEERNRVASSHAEKALELDPESVDALKVLGMLAGDSASRYDYIRRAVDTDPGDSEAWLWLSHLAAHPDYAEHEAEAMRKLVELDPLWGRSWQASNVVANSTGPEAAAPLDNAIADAATQAWQADLARARVANMRGDISQLYAATMRGAASMTREQADIANLQLGNMMLLVELDLPQPSQPGVGNVVAQTIAGRLPSRGEFEAVGLAGKNFWRVVPLVIGGPSLFIREGRTDELLASYDAMFGSPAELLAYSEKGLRAFHYRTNVATYVGLAMRRAGRDSESRALLDLAEQSVARWKANDAMHMTPLLFEANLAAVQGQKGRAIAALERMIELGYPYIVQSPGVALTGPILNDPAWDDLRGDPDIERVLAPIRHNLAKEKREIAAMMAR